MTFLSACFCLFWTGQETVQLPQHEDSCAVKDRRLNMSFLEMFVTECLSYQRTASAPGEQGKRLTSHSLSTSHALFNHRTTSKCWVRLQMVMKTPTMTLSVKRAERYVFCVTHATPLKPAASPHTLPPRQ